MSIDQLFPETFAGKPVTTGFRTSQMERMDHSSQGNSPMTKDGRLAQSPQRITAPNELTVTKIPQPVPLPPAKRVNFLTGQISTSKQFLKAMNPSRSSSLATVHSEQSKRKKGNHNVEMK